MTRTRTLTLTLALTLLALTLLSDVTLTTSSSSNLELANTAASVAIDAVGATFKIFVVIARMLLGNMQLALRLLQFGWRHRHRAYELVYFSLMVLPAPLLSMLPLHVLWPAFVAAAWLGAPLAPALLTVGNVGHVLVTAPTKTPFMLWNISFRGIIVYLLFQLSLTLVLKLVYKLIAAVAAAAFVPSASLKSASEALPAPAPVVVANVTDERVQAVERMSTLLIVEIVVLIGVGLGFVTYLCAKLRSYVRASKPSLHLVSDRSDTSSV